MNLPSLNEPHAGTNLDAEKALGSFVANGSAQSRFGMRPGRGGMMKEGADFSQMMTGLSGLFKTAGPEVIPSVAAEKVQKATGAEGDLRVGMTDQQEEDIPDSGKAISLLAVPFQSSLPVETFFSSSSSTGALQLLFLVNEPMMRKAGQGGEGEEKISVSGSGVLDSTFRVKSENVSEIFRFAEDGLNASPGSQAARVNDGRVPHGGGAELQSAEGRDDSPEGSLGGFGFQAERVKDASFQDTAVAFERPGQSTLRDGEKPVALPGDGPGRQGEASLRHSGSGKVVSMAGHDTATAVRPRETRKSANNANAEGINKVASGEMVSVRFDQPSTEKVSEGAFPYRSVLDQVREGMVAGFKDGGRVRITLYPESLGRVDMDIVLRQDRVDVIMKVDSNQVHQLLSSRVEDLKATLQNQGWQVSGVDVMLQKHNDMNDGNNFANMFSWPDRMNRDRHSGGMAGGRNGNRAAESMDDISAAMRKPPVGTTNGLSIFA